jgi:hypothetical protein
MPKRILIFTCILVFALHLTGGPGRAAALQQEPTPQPVPMPQVVANSARLARQVLNILLAVHLLPDLAALAPTVVPPGSGQSLPPERWPEWPVLPVVSQRARQIYQEGLKRGNDPLHFSKVGDCQVIRQYFLGLFDESGTYFFGPKYDYLIRTVTYFAGSWGRVSEAVRTGFNVASVLTPASANPKTCQAGETPLECEFRAWRPSIVLVSMETWTNDRPTTAYEGYLRQIIEFAISNSVLPILATKADNLEGDQSINATVARLAAEYDIPLWNFWRAANPLPDHGLTGDGFHLTNGINFYDKPENLQKAWPVRNLTAAQAIDVVWKAVR